MLLVPSAGIASDRLRIAVYQFDSRAGLDPGIAINVTDLFQTELAKLNRFDVLERANLQRVLKEQALQGAGCVESSCAVKIGNLLGVQKMVVGAVFRMGGAYFINLHLVDVELSRVDISESASTDQESGIPALVAKIARSLTTRIPISARVVKIGEGRTAVCNLGPDDGVRVGDRVQLIRWGDAIVDPSSGALLGRERVELGRATLVSFPGPALGQLQSETNISWKVGDQVAMIGAPANVGSTGDGSAGGSTKPGAISREAMPASQGTGTRFQERDMRKTKTSLCIMGPLFLAGGGASLGFGLYFLDKHPATVTAYSNATANVDEAYRDMEWSFIRSFGLTAGGIALLSAGAVTLISGLALPRVLKTAIPVSVYPLPDGICFRWVAQF